jgi:hypothetical protein
LPEIGKRRRKNELMRENGKLSKMLINNVLNDEFAFR